MLSIYDISLNIRGKDSNNLLINYKPHKQIVKLANRQIKMKY